MVSARIKARGQAALFAGIWLVAIIPFFQFGALLPSGYGDAAIASLRSGNEAPILAWAAGHTALVVLFPLLEAIPVVLALGLPITLQRAVFGNDREGRVGRWSGQLGLALIALVTVVDGVILLVIARQFTGANAADQIAIGQSFRYTATVESLIVDILGFLLLAIWLGSVSIPLARLQGLERIAGFLGVGTAAVMLATGGLIAFEPLRSQGTLAGTALALFGLWLALIGYVLTRNASALGAAIDDAPPTPEPDPTPQGS